MNRSALGGEAGRRLDRLAEGQERSIGGAQAELLHRRRETCTTPNLHDGASAGSPARLASYRNPAPAATATEPPDDSPGRPSRPEGIVRAAVQRRLSARRTRPSPAASTRSDRHAGLDGHVPGHPRALAGATHRASSTAGSEQTSMLTSV
jgi:hypothetical protein